MPNNELIAALVKAQLEIKDPVKDKVNSHHKNKYCSVDSMLAAVRVPLANNGLTLSHSIATDNGQYFLISSLNHISGGSLCVQMPLLIGKADMQGIGSARTYAVRYNIANLLSLASDEDDDGNESVTQCNRAPEKPIYLSSEDISELEALIGEDMEFLNNVLKHNKAKKLSEVKASEFRIIRDAALARKSQI